MRERDKRRATAPFAVLLLAALATASALFPRQGSALAPREQGRTYYVAVDGDDAQDGLAPVRERGRRGPFRTLARAAGAVEAGDTVLIRGGTYHGASNWAAHGTEDRPITVTNFSGEAVLLDGQDFKVPSGVHGVLLQVYGNWYRVSNLEIRRSGGSGLAVHGDHCVIDHVYAHDNWNSGIYITGSHGLVTGCRASTNSLMNENARMKISWGFGISACRYPKDTVIRGCTSWDNWGEGISTFESQRITIEDCVSYNNQCNFYLSDTQDCLFQRNLAYCTPGNNKQPLVVQANISLGDERRVPPSRNNTVINNAALGGERNFVAGGRELTNALVAHNTFVDAVDAGGSEPTNVYFHAGEAAGARFLNNIVLQEDATAISHLEARGISFGHNGWSRRPLTGCLGKGDIIGNPRILKLGPAGPGALTPDWFRLSATSPVRDRGIPLPQVTTDLVRHPRDLSPDMGALEVVPLAPRSKSSRGS